VRRESDLPTTIGCTLPEPQYSTVTSIREELVETFGVDEFGPASEPFYEPHRWFPHVGFAFADAAAETTAIAEFLLDYDLDWQFTVGTVTITRPPEDGDLYETVATMDLRTDER